MFSEGSGCYYITFYLLPSLKYTSIRVCRRLIKPWKSNNKARHDGIFKQVSIIFKQVSIIFKQASIIFKQVSIIFKQVSIVFKQMSIVCKASVHKLARDSG